MWVLFARAPLPDARPWPGRRWLAALDALAWPAAWLAIVAWQSAHVGAVGQLMAAVAIVAGVGRLHRALATNHRYHFTSWTWGKRLGWLLLLGYALKLCTIWFAR